MLITLKLVNLFIQLHHDRFILIKIIIKIPIEFLAEISLELFCPFLEIGRNAVVGFDCAKQSRQYGNQKVIAGNDVHEEIVRNLTNLKEIKSNLKDMKLILTENLILLEIFQI